MVLGLIAPSVNQVGSLPVVLCEPAPNGNIVVVTLDLIIIVALGTLTLYVPLANAVGTLRPIAIC